MPESVLFRWPDAATFGRTIPKTKFYEHSNVRTSLRAKFVAEIQRITWAFKLSDDTIRLRGTDTVPEIQVFTIDTKSEDASDDVLAAIDRSVHFPIVFEVASGDRVRTVAAQKTLHGKAVTLGAYFTSDWQLNDAPRRTLPAALDLPSLYEALLSTLLPIQTRDGEAVSAAIARLDRAKKLQREMGALERKLRTEPQFNRKIEIRRQLNERSARLAELTDPAPSNKE